jgi:3-oxoacyl-[acyl-carrier protein] reductase
MFKNKFILITGCNKGIGRSTLEKFYALNANCIACVRKKNKEFNNYIKNKKRIAAYYFDLENEEEIKNNLNLITKTYKKIDILINNAAQLENSFFLATPINNIKKNFQINFFSQLLIIQIIAKKMMIQKKGNIINIGSTSGINGNYGRLAYSASKSALMNSTQVLAEELKKFNIRVNTVAPGMTDTDMIKINSKKLFIQEEMKKMSISRLAEPNEIANAISFLASDESSYMNGQTLIVNGA